MDLLKKLGIEKDITSKLYGWVNYLKAYKAYIAPLGVAEMNVSPIVMIPLFPSIAFFL